MSEPGPIEQRVLGPDSLDWSDATLAWAREQDAERAAMQARIVEMLRLLRVAASVCAALRAVIDDTDWDTDDHDGKFGHLPYATFVEAARILLASEKAQQPDALDEARAADRASAPERFQSGGE